MDAKDHFALNWSNYDQHIIKAFKRLYGSKDLTDVTLWVEGKCFQAHRLVLSVCSNYFQDIFKHHQNTPNLAIVLNDVKHTIMADVLRFMYLGEVQVENDVLNEFLQTAELFKINSLTEPNEEEDDEKSHSLVARNSEDRSVDGRDASWEKQDSDNISPKKRTRRSDDEVSLLKNKLSKPRRRSSSSENDFQPNISKSKKDDEAHDTDEADQKLLTDESFLDPTINPNFECPVCGRAMSSMHSLRNHYITHRGDVSCKYCNLTFSRRDILKRHIARQHNA